MSRCPLKLCHKTDNIRKQCSLHGANQNPIETYEPMSATEDVSHFLQSLLVESTLE
jgi:hypothetical protein